MAEMLFLLFLHKYIGLISALLVQPSAVLHVAAHTGCTFLIGTVNSCAFSAIEGVLAMKTCDPFVKMNYF